MRWGLFPKNSLTPCGKKNFDWGQGLTTFFEKNYLLKVFPVPGNFGGLWYTTWQLCCGNNSNDLGIDL